MTTCRVLRRQVLVERLLVEGARLAVDGDEERLVAHRLDRLAEVLGDEARRPCSTRSGFLSMFLQRHRPLEDRVQLLDVADALELGQVEELPLQRLPVHLQVVRGEGVVERHGRAVLDRLADRVLVEVALLVVGAEDLERALAVGGRSMGVPVKPM